MNLLFRLRRLISSNLKQIFRSKLMISLTFILPLYFIVLMNVVHPERIVMIPIGDTLAMVILTDLATMGMVPVIISILGGVMGFFTIKEGEIGSRLKISGFSVFEILSSKLLMLLAFLLFIVGYAFLIMFYLTIPANVGWFILGIFLAGAVYSTIGLLAGVFLEKLPGMYLMLFMPMLDLILFQSPMVDQEELGSWVKYLPGHNPMKIVIRATVGVEQEMRIVLFSISLLTFLLTVTLIIVYIRLKHK